MRLLKKHKLLQAIYFLMLIICSNLMAQEKTNFTTPKEIEKMLNEYQFKSREKKCTLTVNCRINEVDLNEKTLICDQEMLRFQVKVIHESEEYPGCKQILQGHSCTNLCSIYNLFF